MYDPKFLNTSWAPAKTSKGRQAPELPLNRVEEKNQSGWGRGGMGT